MQKNDKDEEQNELTLEHFSWLCDEIVRWQQSHIKPGKPPSKIRSTAGEEVRIILRKQPHHSLVFFT